MIQWYREGKFPLERFVEYFDVCDPGGEFPSKVSADAIDRPQIIPKLLTA